MSIFDKIRKNKNKKYKKGLEKSRKELATKLNSILLSHSEFDKDLFDELEEMFIMADIGVKTVFEFMEFIQDDPKVKQLKNPQDLKPIIVDKMFELYLKGDIINANLNLKDKLNVVLFVGVNGVGKTSSIAKVAYKLKQSGKSVLIAAGDTFRAGAIEQLQIWGKRIDVDVVTKKEGSDPSSVIYDAIQIAKENNIDVLLCDTAGRLQTKKNLMAELSKIKRVISREVEDAPQETLLVIDATTGQNGMSQAKAFIESTDVTGVVLTKLDGTAKGGIVLAIRNELDIPIKLVTLGEQIEDLEVFDIEQYIYGLFSDVFN